MLYQISKFERMVAGIRYKQMELIYAPTVGEALRIYKELHTVENEKKLDIKAIVTYGALHAERGEVHIDSYVYYTQ